jgi:protein O-mannosyl-transferase
MSESAENFVERLGMELRQKPILVFLALALVVVVLYAPVAGFGFLWWDDNFYLTMNPQVQAGLSLPNILWAFKDIGTFYWHPLTWLSHMLACQLFGMDAGRHHLLNLLLHSVNAVLLGYLLFKVTGAFWRSVMVGFLFALHPLNVESVAWLAERKGLLCTMFVLLTFAAYGWYAQRVSVRRYVVVACVFLLALMSKPTAVIVPLLLLILDDWPLRRTGKRSWTSLFVEKLPLLGMSFVVSLLTFFGQRKAGALSELGSIPLGMRLEQIPANYLTYLRKILWPADLSPFYPFHPHWLNWTEVLWPFACLAALTAIAIYGRERHRYLLAGWVFFLAAFLPMIGIFKVGVIVVADRFSYVPAIGIFVLAVWGAGEIVERLNVPKAVPVSVALALMCALGWTTSSTLQYWRSGVVLFTHAAEEAGPPNAVIEQLIGNALVAEHRVPEAFPHFVHSCELDPTYDQCHYNIAALRYESRNFKGALEEYELASRYARTSAMKVDSLLFAAQALTILGNRNGANERISSALLIDPVNQRALRLRTEVANY